VAPSVFDDVVDGRDSGSDGDNGSLWYQKFTAIIQGCVVLV